jgi:hypothetical protein
MPSHDEAHIATEHGLSTTGSLEVLGALKRQSRHLSPPDPAPQAQKRTRHPHHSALLGVRLALLGNTFRILHRGRLTSATLAAANTRHTTLRLRLGFPDWGKSIGW